MIKKLRSVASKADRDPEGIRTVSSLTEEINLDHTDKITKNHVRTVLNTLVDSGIARIQPNQGRRAADNYSWNPESPEHLVEGKYIIGNGPVYVFNKN